MQETVKVKFKKLHPDAKIPEYAKPGDAGMDLTATSVEYDDITGNIVYKTGLAIKIPEGYVGLIFPRSSICKVELTLSNSVGVIDSGYIGELAFKFNSDISTIWSHANICDFQKELENGIFNYYESASDEYRNIVIESKIYKVGDRIGQLIVLPYPKIEFEEVKELSETIRGTGGFGSTGL